MQLSSWPGGSPCGVVAVSEGSTASELARGEVPVMVVFKWKNLGEKIRVLAIAAP